MPKLTTLVARALRLVGLDRVQIVPRDHLVVRRFLCPSAKKLNDFRTEPAFARCCREARADHRTYLEENRLLTLWHAVANASHEPGDIVDIGCYRGGSTRFLARAAESRGWQPAIHAVDTFQGHPTVRPEDGHIERKKKFTGASADDVRGYLSDLPNVVVYESRFEDIASDLADRRFAVVHLDINLYASTGAVLQIVWPRLTPGGVIVIDDYGFVTCPGVAKAVDEFLAVTPDTTSWYPHSGQLIIQRRTMP